MYHLDREPKATFDESTLEIIVQALNFLLPKKN